MYVTVCLLTSQSTIIVKSLSGIVAGTSGFHLKKWYPSLEIPPVAGAVIALPYGTIIEEINELSCLNSRRHSCTL